MPSNIRPKDFENHLPKETDTVAQGLVKFAQFAILFWRWFRSEFKTDGSFGQTMKVEMCETGCSDPEVVGEGGGESADDDNIRDPDSGGGGGPVIPSLPNGECCKTVEKYGAANTGFDEFGNLTGPDTDFTFFQPVVHGTNTGAVDLMCDANNNKQVCIRANVGHGAKFRSNDHWSNSVKIWRSASNSTVNFANSFEGTTYIPSDANREVGEAIAKGGAIPFVEVVLYGRSEGLEVPDGADPKARIGGFFQTNPDAENQGSKIPFEIETGGDWCVRLIVREWQLKKQTAGGFADRSFEFFISKEVPKKYRDRDKPHKSAWWRPKKYLTKIEGIRMANVSSKFYMTRFGNNPVQVGDGGLFPSFCFYDERWQNEIPCFLPTEEDLLSPVDALAPWWTRDGKRDGLWEIYPFSAVNNRTITHDLKTVN